MADPSDPTSPVSAQVPAPVEVPAGMVGWCDPVRCAASACDPVICNGRALGSNDEVMLRSQAVIPGGVNSSIRAFASVGGRPYVVSRAAGAEIWDVEGTRYLDLVQSYGAVILGHAHPDVTAAISAAAADGTSYGAPTPREMRLAEQIRDSVVSCEQVRFMNSGTEATSTAVRLARGYTGRDVIVTFHGNFHGATDALLAAGGSGVATLGLPGTAGVPKGSVAATMVVPYNQVPTLSDEVAAVIVEPVAANMGLVAPAPGFLEGVRAECDRVGAVLIFDEVITGFRLGRGGAQAKYDVAPDLTCFGKVIGGGLPIGAVGGRRAIMETLTPLGPVFHAGTLAGNPIATAAGLAAMNLLNGDLYMELMARARHLSALMGEACTSEGFPARFPVVGTLLGIYIGGSEQFSDDAAASVTNFAQAKTTDEAAYARFFHAMLRNGVAMAPGAYEAIFVGLAHTDEILVQIAEATARAAREAMNQSADSLGITGTT